MQEGLAVLKVGSSFEPARFTNDRIIGRNNNIFYQAKCEFAPKNLAANLPSKSHDSTTGERKKLYDDKAIRTTKNFIGKPFYNVGRSLKVLS